MSEIEVILTGREKGRGERNGLHRLNDPRGKFHGRTDSRSTPPPPIMTLRQRYTQLKDNSDQ